MLRSSSRDQATKLAVTSNERQVLLSHDSVWLHNAIQSSSHGLWRSCQAFGVQVNVVVFG